VVVLSKRWKMRARERECVRAGERKARMSTGAMRDEEGGEGDGRGLMLCTIMVAAVVLVVLLLLRGDVLKDIDR